GSYCSRHIGTLSEPPVANPGDNYLYDFDSLWYDGYGFEYNYRTDNDSWAHGWQGTFNETWPAPTVYNQWFMTYADPLIAFSGYSFMDTWMGDTGYEAGRRYVSIGVGMNFTGWFSFVDDFRVDDIAVMID
ncbi:MAG: hypothetical protein GY869_19080, partial [Planctomycetes bacterium]|nr:hypothetical protein [Planctomycetota bacterium]